MGRTDSGSIYIWRRVSKMDNEMSPLRPKSQDLPASECRHNGCLFSWCFFSLAIIAMNRRYFRAHRVLRYVSDSLCSLNDSSLRVAHARSGFQTRHRGQSIDRRQIRQAPALPARRCHRLYLQRFPTSRLGPQPVSCRSARSGHSE